MPKPSRFITVYSSATGRPQRVPKHYMDDPVLSRGLTRAKPADPTGEPGPSEKWTVAQLQAHAAEHGIDVTDLGAKPTKADLLAAITAAPETSTPTNPETPAAGEN